MTKNREFPDHRGNLVALRRVEGQVRGVGRMIDDRAYCIDIIHQIAAIRGALARVEEKILAKHFANCLRETFSQSDEDDKQEKLQEILQLIHQTRRR